MIPSTTSEPAARRPATVDVPGVRRQRRPATRRRASQDHRGVHHSSLTDIDGGPRRRATQDHSIFLSLQSDCIARLNSIRFRHDEPDRYEDSSRSGDDSRDLGSKGMEVMDLRPNAHLRDLEESSLISLSSNNSNDSELPSGLKLANGLFPVAGSGGGGVGGDAPLREDLPKHWGAYHSHRAKMPFMRSGDDDEKGSFVSSIAIAALPRDGSSKLWDELETSSKLTESSPLTDKKKRRQRHKLYVRRCARTIVGLMAFAALSGSIRYFVSEKDYRSVHEFLLGNNFLGRLLGDDNNNSEEQQEGFDYHLLYRRLPQGGNVEKMVPTSGVLGNDHYDKDIPPQEREHRARGQLILAREHRVRVRREARAQEERTAGRKTMTQDGGYYNGVHQDYPTTHQDHNLVDERWNNPHQEYHQEYNGYPPMEEGRRALTQEDEGQYNVHQDNPVYEDYPENFVPQDGIDYQDGGWIQRWWTRM